MYTDLQSENIICLMQKSVKNHL